MEIIRQDLGIKPWGFSNQANFTAISFKKGKKLFFIRNGVSNVSGSFNTYEEERSKEECKEAIKQLESNNGQYYCLYCRFPNPFNFINWIKENKFTFQIHGELFYKGESFTDFQGNLLEYSSAFCFRIYSQSILNKIKNEIKDIKQYYHYKTKTA